MRLNGQLQLQVLVPRALMHVIAGDPEIVDIGKPSSFEILFFSAKWTCAYQQPALKHGWARIAAQEA